MQSSDNNNNQMLFVSEFKELRKELSAMKKRIDELEKSQEKQQERINILERQNNNNVLKKKKGLNIDGNKEGEESVLKRKRTEKDHHTEKEIESKSTSDSSSKKSKTNNNNNNNNNDYEVAVLSQRDNGDSFDSLSDDLLHKIVEFDGNCYEKFGSINKRCKNIYDVKEYKLKKQTCLFGYGTVEMMLERYLQKRKEGTLDELWLDERNSIAETVIIYNRLDAIDWIIQLGDNELLRWVCLNAAYFGKINILSKVFIKNNLTTLDELLDDRCLCENAALNGHLRTLKWLRNHGAKWDAQTFISAKNNGYDEIVQYLRNEGCPGRFLYIDESSESEQLGSEDGD